MSPTARTPTGPAAPRPAPGGGDHGRDDGRVRLRAPVEVLASARGGPVLLPGLLADLSAGGCAVRVGLPLEPGVRVRLVLGLGQDHLAVFGQVVWAAPRDRAWVAGVRFDPLGPAKRAAIERYIFSARRHRPG
ncbi:MAG: hypothetical protein KatS3mg009_2655 [Acidimicrobiia bacterium]|nr:MAG: hypothetical protein KatS3mg009_2655 [Acidimicrobiia bacterium]